MTTTHFVRILDEVGEKCEILRPHAAAEVISCSNLHIDDGDLFLFVPSCDISILPIALPSMSAGQLRQALPYALEEYVLTDPENSHLAIDNPRGPNWVAVVAKEKMQQWLQLAKATGAKEIKIYPDIYALPVISDAWVLALDEKTARLRCGPGEGWAVPLPECEQFLQLTLNKTTNPPAKILVYSSIKTAAFKLVVPLEASNEYLPLDIPDIMSGIALTQAEFRVSPISNLKKTWFAAAAIFAATVFLQAVSGFWQYARLQHDKDNLDAEIATQYHKVFPQAKSVNSPRTLIQRELDNANKQNANVTFLNLLIKFSAALEKVQNAEVQQISFHNNTLQVNLNLPTFQQLDKLVTQLRSTGLNVAQDTAMSHDKLLEAKLTIKGS